MDSAIDRVKARANRRPIRDLAIALKDNWLLYVARLVLLVSFIVLVFCLQDSHRGADWGPMLISMSIVFSGSLTTLAILRKT